MAPRRSAADAGLTSAGRSDAASHSPRRIFLLSPARSDGARARVIFNPNASFDLARRVRSRSGASLGEVYTFLSGLYFRAKLLYALAFSSPPARTPGVLVITPAAGLRPPDDRIDLERPRGFADAAVDARDSRYREPLVRDARRLAARIAQTGASCEIVLLGSIATGKYVEPLGSVFGDSLRFPIEFVGRGDMSRGGLMLRALDAGRELDYVPIAGAVRRGPRPPKLEPRRRSAISPQPPRARRAR